MKWKKVPFTIEKIIMDYFSMKKRVPFCCILLFQGHITMMKDVSLKDRKDITQERRVNKIQVMGHSQLKKQLGWYLKIQN